MAIFLTKTKDGKLLEIAISGRLTDEDYQHFVPEFERLVSGKRKVNVLFEMRHFRGWDAKAARDEFKFDEKHCRDIDRLAVVGEKRWQWWMTQVCRPFTRARLCYFEVTGSRRARAWLAEAGGGAGSSQTTKTNKRKAGWSTPEVLIFLRRINARARTDRDLNALFLA